MPDFVKVVLLLVGVVEGSPGEVVDGPAVVQADVCEAEGDCVCRAGRCGGDEEVGAERDCCSDGSLERERKERERELLVDGHSGGWGGRRI